MPRQASRVTRHARAQVPTWTVRADQKTGKALLVDSAGGRRVHATLPMAFDAQDDDNTIIDYLRELSALVHNGMTTKTAVKVLAGGQQDEPIERMPGCPKSEEHFYQQLTKFGSQITEESWNKKQKRIIHRVKFVMETLNPPPANANDLAMQVLPFWTGGSRQRIIMAQALAAYLHHCCDHLGYAEQWRPPANIRIWKGAEKVNASDDETITRYKGREISDIQIWKILSEIDHLAHYADQKRRRDSHQMWWRAVYLMAIYGLRPIELRYLHLDKEYKYSSSCLWCSYRKKNGAGATEPRRVHPLYLRNKDATARNVPHLNGVDVFKEFDLDAVIAPHRCAGEGFRTYFRKRTVWQELDQLLDDNGDNLVTYTFRHSYSRRGHDLGNSAPKMAIAMGHTLDTHLRAYDWSGDNTMDDFIS